MDIIVPAVVADAVKLEKLVNKAYRGDSSKRGWTTEADLLDGTRTDAAALEELINTRGIMVLKYVEDGEISGCVELRQVPEGMYVGMLTVDPERQAGGIGKKLLHAAESEAAKRQCQKMLMTVISVRTELIGWYKRHGYRDTGIKKPFNFNDPRFGIPKQQLEFVVLEKRLTMEEEGE
jgi:ribosomal protein S18 acetylase RimI-like enzyme